MRIIVIVSIIVILSAIAVSPTSNFPITNQIEDINVTISGFQFTPNSIEVEVGQTVNFVVNNQDGSPHTFTVTGEFDIVLPASSSGSQSWTAPTTAQTLTIRCSYHSSMTATLLVIESTSSTSSTSDSETSGENTESDPTSDLSDTSSDTSSDSETPSSDSQLSDTDSDSDPLSSSPDDSSPEEDTPNNLPEFVSLSPIHWFIGFLFVPVLIRRWKTTI